MINSIFIPQDAYLLQKQVAYATECSQSDYFMNRHFLSTAHAVSAVALAVINVPLYLIQAVGDLLVNAVQLNFKQMGQDLRNDLLGFSQSFMLSVVGTFYVFSGLFFPRQVYGNFTTTPQEPNPIVPYPQYLREHQERERAEERIRECNGQMQDLMGRLEQATVDLEELDPARRRSRDLQQAVDGLQEEIGDLRSDLEDAQRQLSLARSAPPTAHSELAALRLQLQEAERKFTDADRALQLKDDEVVGLRERNRELRDQGAYLESQLQDAQDWFTKQRATIAAQSKQLKAIQKEKDSGEKKAQEHLKELESELVANYDKQLLQAQTILKYESQIREIQGRLKKSGTSPDGSSSDEDRTSVAELIKADREATEALIRELKAKVDTLTTDEAIRNELASAYARLVKFQRLERESTARMNSVRRHKQEDVETAEALRAKDIKFLGGAHTVIKEQTAHIGALQKQLRDMGTEPVDFKYKDADEYFTDSAWLQIELNETRKHLDQVMDQLTSAGIKPVDFEYTKMRVITS